MMVKVGYVCNQPYRKSYELPGSTLSPDISIDINKGDRLLAEPVAPVSSVELKREGNL